MGAAAKVNSRQIRYFVEVVRCKSYTKAAERLFVTPRAVSKGIHGLEGEIGNKLFVNDNGSIVPTKFALGYMEPALGLLDALEALESCPHQRPSSTSLPKPLISITNSRGPDYYSLQ